ncbi:MAG: glycosyltransferase, partial [Ottowia sp.]
PTVDIIVPVYRGLRDTQVCIDAVLAGGPRTDWRLIVINDCSPEPEVTAWLRDKAAAEPRITLLENEHNLGFVGTVNRGMRQSEHNDVLLLNSDTEVAGDWLDRLRAAAYRQARAGTVTPFSGNATICSYPVFCADNPLPPGHSTASLDRLFAQVNAGQSVPVPTGVGFCMYIRRDCLQAVGLFDEAHFGKGYGEENDFCQRAIGLGWHNLHALDTYVLHTGGVSFGDSKSPREQAAMETLRRLHPGYDAQVQRFLQLDPARPARLAVDWLRHTDGGRRQVVLVVQHQRGGGTERHILELAATLADTAVLVSLRPAGGQRVQLQLIEQDAGRWAPSRRWAASFDLGHDGDALLRLLRDMAVSHVRYHHLLGHAPRVWTLAHELGVAYDVTCHDFYSFCTHITLTGRHGRYQMDAQGECCGGDHPPSLPETREPIDAWRIRNRRFLQQARFVLTPSLDTAERMRRAMPGATLRCAPHTDILPDTLPMPQPPRLAAQEPLRIVAIGALSVIKGADVLEETARLARRAGAPLEFHLIGYGYRHLQTAPGTALTVHGQYADEDLPALLQRLAPHLAWFPAQWPETYSYTLSAALQAGLPVAVPDLGAFAERVAERPWSWVQAWDSSASQWLELFLRIRQQAFVDGQVQAAPPLSAPLQALRRQLGDWQYASDYLPAAAPAPWPEQLERARRVAAALAQAAPADAAAAPLGADRLYALALRLQRLPLLGRALRAVPRSWRYRVRQLLSR